MRLGDLSDASRLPVKIAIPKGVIFKGPVFVK